MNLGDIHSGVCVTLVINKGSDIFSFKVEVIDSMTDLICVKAESIKSNIFRVNDVSDIVILYPHKGVLYKWCVENSTLGKKGDIIVYFLRAEGEGLKYNRRQAFRVCYDDSIILELDNDSSFKINGVLSNISETGVCIVTDFLFQIGEKVCFDIVYNNKELYFTASVIRKENINSNFICYGCKIVKINNMKLFRDLLFKRQLDDIRRLKNMGE